jgi:putative hydrolase of the HAD superfamily
MPAIRATTFDLDGVYFLNGKINFQRNLLRLGVSDAEVDRVYFKSAEMNAQYKIGALSDKEYWSWALREWKLDLSVAEVTRLLIDGYEANEKVRLFVKHVRKKGYKTLICSNNFPARIDGLEARFDFLADFDAATLSYDVGATKPSTVIFEDLIKRSGVYADEIVFADDDEEKLSGAKTLGIRTFVYTGFENFLSSLRRLGVEA